MSVKAQWFTPDIELDDDGDPFDLVDDDGETVVDLSTDEERLARELSDTIKREARLDAQSVTCEIKDRADTSCWACPLFRGHSSEPIAPLCRLGREQGSLLTRLAVLRAGAGE